MINVDLKINCNCQAVISDYTDYCEFGYDPSEVVIVEGITGLGYNTIGLNNGCIQTRQVQINNLTELTNTFLYPCDVVSNDGLAASIDYLNDMIGQILYPCSYIPDEPESDNPDNLNCNCINEPISIWQLEKDGYYRYYRILVYNHNKGGIYWDGTTLKYGMEKLLVEDLDSYLQHPSVAHSLGILDYIQPISFFSICNLKKCVMELQKNYINNQLVWCNSRMCKQTDEEEFKFLFISVNLLEKLIECEKYHQAEKILNSISTCTSICSNIKYNKKCNCHG